jgi:hypothetical protein
MLLPCIHCRNSYIKFYNALNVDDEIDAGRFEFILFTIHGLVKAKLFDQRFNDFFEIANLKPNLKNSLANIAAKTLNFSPTLEILHKRWLISEGKPFAEKSVWIVLFTMILDNKDWSHDKKKALIDWMQALSILIESKARYTVLHAKLTSVDMRAFLDSKTAKEGFAIVWRARNSDSLTHSISEDSSNSTENYKTNAYLNDFETSWTIFSELMPARSCAVLTCK